MKITIIEEITHARLSDKAVLLVGEMLINEVLKRITKNMMRMTCSRNSVTLIEKNFF